MIGSCQNLNGNMWTCLRKDQSAVLMLKLKPESWQMIRKISHKPQKFQITTFTCFNFYQLEAPSRNLSHSRTPQMLSPQAQKTFHRCALLTVYRDAVKNYSTRTPASRAQKVCKMGIALHYTREVSFVSYYIFRCGRERSHCRETREFRHRANRCDLCFL